MLLVEIMLGLGCEYLHFSQYPHQTIFQRVELDLIVQEHVGAAVLADRQVGFGFFKTIITAATQINFIHLFVKRALKLEAAQQLSMTELYFVKINVEIVVYNAG